MQFNIQILWTRYVAVLRYVESLTDVEFTYVWKIQALTKATHNLSDHTLSYP